MTTVALDSNFRPWELRRLVKESNRIEGIIRDPTLDELAATQCFLGLDTIHVTDLDHLVGVFQPGNRLRDRPGLDVRVGTHIPPPGGPQIRPALEKILKEAMDGEHPYLVHQRYETWHPYTDGNGRSGRALWWWGMRHQPEPQLRHALDLGFLHWWYYQSLEFGR